MSTPDEKIVQKPSGSRTGMYAVVAVVVIVVLLVVVAWGAGWLTPKSSTTKGTNCTPPAAVAIQGAGSTFVQGLLATWTPSYTEGTVSYSAVGSGTGITDLTSKTVDFGASDAPLSPAQRGALPGPVVTIPETAGGVVLIYNVPGVATLNFSGAVLAKIYMGNITVWNDPAIVALNPGITLPSNAIVPVYRSDGSGTSFAYSDFLSKSSSVWSSLYGKSTSPAFPVGTGAHGTSAVGNAVKTTQYTIGYLDLGYALSNGLTFGRVVNPSGAAIFPTLSDTASAVADGAASLPLGTAADWYNVSLINEAGATDYPITTFSYLMVFTSLDGIYGSAYNLQKAENLVDWLNWTVTAGQSYAAQLYYVPLPAAVTAADQTTIKAITFGGATIPVCTT
ncbi:MAG: phosphate ABC transporter substrate-binding protein PstS [Thermoplasmata archaeon]|nr:phosphate ABC transporter substrate-binding protein PstS [Thermoplasmata archaeon]